MQLPYAMPNRSVGLTTTDVGVPVLWWRSVGSTHTAYAVETFLDELAEAAGTDPLDFRLALLSEAPRHAGVLRLAAEKAGWGTPRARGSRRGIALAESFHTYVAQVVEVSVGDGGVKVHKVVCAVDCGVPINPDNIRAQMEGGIGFGLGAILAEELTLTGGVVDQANYDTYTPLRIDAMPEVEVHIVPRPSGQPASASLACRRSARRSPTPSTPRRASGFANCRSPTRCRDKEGVDVRRPSRGPAASRRPVHARTRVWTLPGRRPRILFMPRAQHSTVVGRHQPRPLNPTQVESTPPPAHLTKEARDFWVAVLPALTNAGVVSALDGPALAQMAEAYGDWLRARRVLAKEGPLLKRRKVIRETSQRAKDGRVRTFETIIDVTPIPHPAMFLASEADNRFRRWLIQFGMTPSSRIAMARRLLESGYRASTHRPRRTGPGGRRGDGSARGRRERPSRRA